MGSFTLSVFQGRRKRVRKKRERKKRQKGKWRGKLVEIFCVNSLVVIAYFLDSLRVGVSSET